MTMKIRGVCLAPGVSGNGRYYSPAMIRAAVEQAQPRVQTGRMLMRAYHDAPDTIGYVGRLTSLRVNEDGAAAFEAEMADTSTARDVAALIRGKSPFVSGVSIMGRWLGKTHRVQVGNQHAETCSSGLQIDSVDFTGTPGVDAARIVGESIQGKGKRFIFESAPGPVEALLAVPDPYELAQLDNGQLADLMGAAYEAERATRPGRMASPFWRD